jgi:hypothetical protein
MRRSCPYLLGALLIALICLGGGLDRFDLLLGPLRRGSPARCRRTPPSNSPHPRP